MKTINDITEWLYNNLDLIEECQENKETPVVLIAGASSSGKSYTAKQLKNFLSEKNFNVVTLSTDDYNNGIAKNIYNIVNKKYYNNSLKNSELCIEKIKKIIINSDFDKKFCNENLQKIKKECEKYINENINKFLAQLKFEFENINFDQKEVYDLNGVSNDIVALCNKEQIKVKRYSKKISEQLENDEIIDGKKVDVILVEGIYALSDEITSKINNKNLIKNFIECDSKNLFLRRLIRDASITDCPKGFILQNYLKYVMPEYINTVLPTKEKSDIVLQNNMTFQELRTGKIEYQRKYRIEKEEVRNLIKKSKIIKKERQIDTFFGKKDEKNILRLREIENENGEMEMNSLIYKSSSKLRKDGSLIRYTNVLAEKEDLKSIFKRKENLVSHFDNIEIESIRSIKKTRLYVRYLGQTIKIDAVNGKFYIEVDGNETQSESLHNIQKDKSNEFIRESTI